MANYQFVLGMLVVTNFIALFTVASRLQKRYIRNTLWVDDIFAVATGCGLLFTLSNLFAMVGSPQLKPTEYQLVLGGSMLVVWASRACLVMSTGRLLYFTNRPQSLHFFWTISVLMFSCGIGYSVIASFFCINRTVCPDTGVCFCGLEPYLVFYTLLVNVATDFAMFSITGCILMLGDFAEDPDRTEFFCAGLSTFVFTVMVSSAFWLLYQIIHSENYVFLLSLWNSMAIVSVLSSNTPAIVDLLCRWRLWRWGKGGPEALRSLRTGL